jgi:nucleotide-binding universal stress UspA family protein
MRILALVAEPTTARACLDAALAAALHLDDHATIEAFHVVVDLAHAASSSEELTFERFRELREGTASQRAEQTHAAFVAWSASLPEAGPRVEWKELVGAEEPMVAREAAAAGLLVVAKPRNSEGHHALHAAVFRSGRPLLLVPADWRPDAGMGRHIAIGWNDTPASRKAVGSMTPWLRRAKKVTIILIDEDLHLADSLLELLAPISIAPAIRGVVRARTALGDQLIDEADAIGADLLVMGAYRHEEPLEWLLGGTTRHALRHADLPLLLAH